MAKKPKKSISEQLNLAQVVITNTINSPEILGIVSKFGYTKEKMEEGKLIYNQALEAVNYQTMTAGMQYQATQETQTAMKEAKEAYINLAKIARAVFNNDKSKLAQLGITGPQPKSTAQIISQGYTAFNNALNIPEIKTALSYFGYDEVKLNNEMQKIVAFDQANQKQELAKGTAQQATKEQETALKNLDNWISQYVKIARVALKDKKQLLEQLGIKAYSSKTAAQREAPKKAAATREAKKVNH